MYTTGTKKKKRKLRKGEQEERSLGSILLEARRAKNISLQEVERHTNIKARSIKYLEEDKFHLLPPAPYTKGFLRLYAKYVGLNPDQIVEQYMRQNDTQCHQDLFLRRLRLKQQQSVSGKLAKSVFLAIGVALFVLMAYGVVIFFWPQDRKEQIEAVLLDEGIQVVDQTEALLESNQGNRGTTRLTLSEIIGEEIE